MQVGTVKPAAVVTTCIQRHWPCPNCGLFYFGPSIIHVSLYIHALITIPTNVHDGNYMTGRLWVLGGPLAHTHSDYTANYSFPLTSNYLEHITTVCSAIDLCQLSHVSNLIALSLSLPSIPPPPPSLSLLPLPNHPTPLTS